MSIIPTLVAALLLAGIAITAEAAPPDRRPTAPRGHPPDPVDANSFPRRMG